MRPYVAGNPQGEGAAGGHESGPAGGRQLDLARQSGHVSCVKLVKSIFGAGTLFDVSK